MPAVIFGCPSCLRLVGWTLRADAGLHVGEGDSGPLPSLRFEPIEVGSAGVSKAGQGKRQAVAQGWVGQTSAEAST